MNAASMLRERLALPAGFGQDVHFALFESKAVDGRSGARFELSLNDEAGSAEVLVALTEWRDTPNGREPEVVFSAIVDWESGALTKRVGEEADFPAALAAAAAMAPVQ